MDQVSISIPVKIRPMVWGTGFDGYRYRWLKFYPWVTRVKHYTHLAEFEEMGINNDNIKLQSVLQRQ